MSACLCNIQFILNRSKIRNYIIDICFYFVQVQPNVVRRFTKIKQCNKAILYCNNYCKISVFCLSGRLIFLKISRLFIPSVGFTKRSKSPGLTPRFPLRQLGAFRPLRRNLAKLRDRRLSWIVSKRRAPVFLALIKAEITTLTRFYDLSVSRDLFSKAKKCNFGSSGKQRTRDCREPTG